MSNDVRIAGAIVAGIILAGCATTAKNAGPTTAKAGTGANDTTCLTGTGARIPPTDGSCSGVGRSYSGDDIKLTGKTSAAEALQILDPAVTLHR